MGLVCYMFFTFQLHLSQTTLSQNKNSDPLEFEFTVLSEAKSAYKCTQSDQDILHFVTFFLHMPCFYK